MAMFRPWRPGGAMLATLADRGFSGKWQRGTLAGTAEDWL